MNRQEKKLFVDQLKSQFTGTESSVVVGYKGLTVSELQQLRRGLRTAGGSFKVAKARLFKRAVDENARAQELEPFLTGQVGVVFVSENSKTPAVLKFLYNFSKQHEALTLVAGSAESKLLDKAMITALATLPSREVLLAMVFGTFKAPLTKLVCVLKAVSEKKQ